MIGECTAASPARMGVSSRTRLLWSVTRVLSLSSCQFVRLLPPLSTVQPRVFFKKQKTHTVLNCTYFHSRSPFAHHFTPVLPTLLGRPRPPPTLSRRTEPLWVHSGQRVPWYHLKAARLLGLTGANHGPLITVFVARIGDQNQYNKLLGNLRITV